MEPSASLLRISERFQWIQPISSATAPGFVFVGGQLSAGDFGAEAAAWPATSLSGKGLEHAEAFEACVAEGVEHLSRLEWGSEIECHGTFDLVDHGHSEETLRHLTAMLGADGDAREIRHGWLPGTRLADGRRVLLPADLCLHRQVRDTGRPTPSAISTGCAAGRDPEDALRRALLELVERDAVALWWAGGCRARAVSAEMADAWAVPELVQALRRGRDDRRTWLLDITSDLDVPCFVALSVDRDGGSLASGVAADLDPAGAMRGAILELCQSELGHQLVEAKRTARGDAALNDADRRKRGRDAAFVAAAADTLVAGLPAPPRTVPVDADTHPIAVIVERMRAVGISPVAVDLSRPMFGIAVARAVAPGLQPYPSSVVTDRLAAAMRRSGRDPAAVRPALF